MLAQSSNSLNHWWMRIIKPGIERVRVQVAQVLPGELGQGSGQSSGGFRQTDRKAVRLPFVPAGERA